MVALQQIIQPKEVDRVKQELLILEAVVDQVEEPLVLLIIL
jgi:hypothetical protein